MVFLPSWSSCFLIEAAVAAVPTVSSPQPASVAAMAMTRSVFMGEHYRRKRPPRPSTKSSASVQKEEKLGRRCESWSKKPQRRMTPGFHSEEGRAVEPTLRRCAALAYEAMHRQRIKVCQLARTLDVEIRSEGVWRRELGIKPVAARGLDREQAAVKGNQRAQDLQAQEVGAGQRAHAPLVVLRFRIQRSGVVLDDAHLLLALRILHQCHRLPRELLDLVERVLVRPTAGVMDEDFAQRRMVFARLFQVGVGHAPDSRRANKTPQSRYSRTDVAVPATRCRGSVTNV